MLDVGEVHGRGPSWAPSRPLIIFFGIFCKRLSKRTRMRMGRGQMRRNR